MSGKKVFFKWIRMILLGFVLLSVSFYILLASGFLGDVPGKLIASIVSNDSFALTFRGLRTDVFWNTTADSVVVTDSSGLIVAVAGVQIEGSVLDYVFNGHINKVLIDRLDIHLSSYQEEDDNQPDSLISILNNIDAGIAISADRLLLNYGIITEPSGVVIDSMFLDASIDRTFGFVLNVDSAGIYLTGFGQISGCGSLRMFEGIITTDGFNVCAAPGSLLVVGDLNGLEEFLDVEISGAAGTSSFDLPVDLSVSLEGTLKGKLQDLGVNIALSEGKILLFGKEATFEADTISADFHDVTARNLSIVTDDAEMSLDGELDLESMAWSAALNLNMTGTDISEYLAQLSATDVTGSVSAECAGTGSSSLNGSAAVDLTASSSELINISTLHIDAALSDNTFSLGGSVSGSSGNVTFTGNGHIGPDWIPESWTMQADGDISDLAFLREFVAVEDADINSAYFSLSGSGTEFGMNISGNAGARGLDFQGLSAERVSFDGSLNYSARGGYGGISTGISLDGRVNVLGFSSGNAGAGEVDSQGMSAEKISFDGSLNYSVRSGYRGISTGMNLDGRVIVFGFSADGIYADTASAEGTFGMSGSGMTADASFQVDSLRMISDVFHTSADIELDGDNFSINGLTLTGSDGRSYSAEIEIGMRDTLFFAAEDIRATHSKLRVITEGGFSGFAENGTIVLDTLWLDPPVGDLAMSGILSEEITEMRADIVNMDLSSFSTFSGLPADMSGVGNFSVFYRMDADGVQGSIEGNIADPAYGQFSMDSITIDISAENDDFSINGIYAWQNNVRSGLQLKAKDVWAGTEIELMSNKIQWLELEVNNIGDWLFYVLPLPVRTMGASVSARVEYERYNGDYTFEMQASARINRLYITLLGIELPNVNFYLNYPDSTARGYNARFTLGAGSLATGDFSSRTQADIVSLIPFEVGAYDMGSTLSGMEVAIPGIGAVICSGNLSSSGTGFSERPVLSGKINIIEGAVGIPQPVGASSSGGSGEMPFDLSIDVTGTGDIWFRTNFADIEMALKLRIFTLERKPTVNGYVSAVRGRITLLSRDFQITEGRVNIVQGNPPTMQLNVTAETTVRSVVSHEEYVITILIFGDSENPQITLTGQGPDGQIAQEDILTLLGAAITYSEMQQMNSSAIRSEVENVAQTMLGSLLARNLRHEIGLDTFEISPELLSDTTSLVLNVGKYVLPDLYVSYKGDVFSADPGTFSVQYLFSSDFYVEGTSRTTIHGYPEPTLELHYTIRY